MQLLQMFSVHVSQKHEETKAVNLWSIEDSVAQFYAI